MKVSTLILVASLLAASLWTIGFGTYAWTSWPSVAEQMDRDFQAGKRGCKRRYPDPAGTQRCYVVFETQYVLERNGAIFTRILLAILPFGAVYAWRWLQSRPASPRRKGKP